MKQSKNRPNKSRKMFELIPREKGDPLLNDPFSSPNIIVPVQNIEKSFLTRLGITEDMLPQNMRSRPKLEVIDDDTVADPEVFAMLYDDDGKYEAVTDQYIQEANRQPKSVSFGDYGFIMNRFFEDLGGDHDSDEDVDVKPKSVKFSTSLGTSCATSKRSQALKAFDERFQLFLNKEAENEPSMSTHGRDGLADIDLNELSADLDNLMNENPKDVEFGQPVKQQEEFVGGDAPSYDSDCSTVVDESEDFSDFEEGSRRSSLRCMFSGKLVDGSQCDNLSMMSSASRISRPREIVHTMNPRLGQSSAPRKRPTSDCEDAEELPMLPQPDFSKIDRKAWKVMVKEDRRVKRRRKKETKVLFASNKLDVQQLAVRGQSRHHNI